VTTRTAATPRVHRSGVTPILALCFGVPAAILAASYLWLVLDHGTLLLWNVIVHESGRYTFGQTVLYFGHFLREVPIVLAYALFLLSLSVGSAPTVTRAQRGERPATSRIAAAAAVGLIAAAWVATARADGTGSALRDLLQYRTRDDLVGYGTHWRYHLLSTLWFGAATMIVPVISRVLPGVPMMRLDRRRVRAAWLYFGVLTIVFGVSTDVFLDVRYVGHQAREIMTHGPVTLLLGIGFLIAAASRPSTAAPAATTGVSTDAPVNRSVQAAMAGLVLLIPLYLAIISFGGDVMEHGQSGSGLGAMVAAHYFEHTLDYLLVLLLMAAGPALHEHHAASRSNVANGAIT
jgi:hypothetical protein